MSEWLIKLFHIYQAMVAIQRLSRFTPWDMLNHSTCLEFKDAYGSDNYSIKV